MPYLLALDQGTTSSRAIVFDLAGRPLAAAQQELSQHYPQPGWVEHDAEEIWSTQLETAREALRASRVDPRQIAAIGITNQRETTLVWDRRTGRPVAPAIVWQDRRTAAQCDALKARGLEPVFRERSGLVLDPYFSGTKLQWLLDHVGGLRRHGDAGDLAFGTVDTWLIDRLTGGAVHATDVSNASRTLLLNLHTRTWDDELLGILTVPRSMLPAVRPSAARFGETLPDLLGARVPITGVAGDQQAALFGQACLDPGMVKNTYGTGCFMLMQTGPRPVTAATGLLTTVAWQLGDRPVQYALEGAVFIAGAVVQWLRDGLGVIAASGDVERLAAEAPDTGGVYLVPAFVGLGAPYWDPYARGTIVGITRGTGRAQLARAALEAIAYQTRDVLAAMTAGAGLPLAELRVDGGAARNNLLMQFQADILDAPVLRPAVTETTALGAAYLAGIGAGVLAPEDIPRHWTLDRRFTPAMAPDVRTRLYQGWQRAVERARGWEQP